MKICILTISSSFFSHGSCENLISIDYAWMQNDEICDKETDTAVLTSALSKSVVANTVVSRIKKRQKQWCLWEIHIEERFFYVRP